MGNKAVVRFSLLFIKLCAISTATFCARRLDDPWHKRALEQQNGFPIDSRCCWQKVQWTTWNVVSVDCTSRTQDLIESRKQHQIAMWQLLCKCDVNATISNDAILGRNLFLQQMPRHLWGIVSCKRARGRVLFEKWMRGEESDQGNQMHVWEIRGKRDRNSDELREIEWEYEEMNDEINGDHEMAPFHRSRVKYQKNRLLSTDTQCISANVAPLFGQ